MQEPELTLSTEEAEADLLRFFFLLPSLLWAEPASATLVQRWKLDFQGEDFQKSIYLMIFYKPLEMKKMDLNAM